MADVPTPAAAPATEAPAPDDAAALLAEMEAELGTAPAAEEKPAPAAKPTPAPAAAATEDAPEVDADDEEPEVEAPAPDPEDDDDEETEEPIDDDDEVPPEVAADPALKARLDAVRRTEERQRQKLSADRQAFETERQTWIQQREAGLRNLESFQQLVARAKYDVPSVLRALGIGEGDFEYHAQALMAHSPKMADKPEYRQAFERAQREREDRDTSAATARKLADLEKQLAEREKQEAGVRQFDAYLGKALRKVGDDTPITKALITKSPRVARDELTITAGKLAEKLGRLPTTKELLAAHEKKEVRALSLRGITHGAPAAKPAPTAAAAATDAAPAGKAKPAPAVKPNGAKPAPAAPPDKTEAAEKPLRPGERPKIPTNEELLYELQQGGPN